ncbi:MULTISPECIES: ParB N-terminal domain-containing protein [unclassified Nocardia]|uniref:ParB/RepB/Spo0J family partition protein n=1 Tax=unclassified Nocardia TaxID=2637762 RepID=UPI001CE4AB1D|nr:MULTISPECIES: ParB N-terminal domain-containing protein [unclassified Nocardia]
MGTVTCIDSTSVLAGDETIETPITELLLGDSPRQTENAGHIQALAAVRAPLPPIIVHRASMRVIDGAHRLRAAQLRGDDTIEVQFFDGDERDAFVLAVRLNSAHGLPLTLADRKAAAARIIEYHPEWSDRAIAAVAGISDKTVASLRGVAGDVPPSARVGRDGRYHPRNRVDGRIRASELFAANPGASAREVARAAGISATTAKDVRARMRRGVDPVPSQQRTRAAAVATAVRPAIDRRAIVRRLRSDPSMRFSESGRTLLRWLEAPAADDADWDAIARNVPGHCTRAVVELARQCAADWQRFAEVLNSRGSEEAC